MVNSDVISMPDKWEYPWYAAWDLAFHTVTLSMVDQDFAKQQLNLMLNERYLHPNGQFPAYEWNFNDVNPPVHAWAVIFNHRLEEALNGKGDTELSRKRLPKVTDEFHLVGKPKRHRRQQCLPRRLSGIRQHWTFRSQR